MRQQKISREKPKKQPKIVDERQPSPLPALDPAIANKPVRTVVYVEVGNMENERILHMVKEINKLYDKSHGKHYVLPVRNGKLNTDMVFEQEWLKVVKDTCEVNDEGEIVLKGGCEDVHVIRQKV